MPEFSLKVILMKRTLPMLALALCVSALLPSSADAWWWSRHKSAPPAGAGATSKPVKPKKEKHRNDKPKGEHLYNFPKSWGWFHKSPGPAGAGS